jgi:hypothetical protein
MNPCTRYLLASATLALLALPAAAQELSPRAYWPAPKGTKLFFSGYVYSWGDVVTDPSLPVVGVDSRLNTVVAGYLQTLKLWGRTSNVLVEVPYTWGTTEGTLEGQPARRDLGGFGDLGVTLSVNLLGAPSMTPPEFQELRKNPRQILGVSLKVVAPTGDYDPDKLLNVGTNRWAVKAEFGCAYPITAKWILELELGGWYIWDNDEFLGTTREQAPIGALEIHLIRRIKPGFWVSADFNHYAGGRTTVGGELRADLQRNTRLGATLAYPLASRHVFKANLSTGVATASGGDFNMILLTYLLRL